MGNTMDYLRGLYDEYKKPELEFNACCHDCHVVVKVISTLQDDGELSITGGTIYKIAGIDKPFFKCESCLNADSFLRHFQPCEVYSRVCGYLRPVKQFNKGKQEEFKERVNYQL
jgi:hypothetical protein